MDVIFILLKNGLFYLYVNQYQQNEQNFKIHTIIVWHIHSYAEILLGNQPC